MDRRREKRWAARVVLRATLGLGLALALPAQAAGTDYDRELEGWSQRIAALSQHSFADQTSQEIELARTWTSRCEALVANEEYKKASWQLERIAALVEYVEARQKRLWLYSAARRAEAKADEADRRAAAATKAAQAAKDKKRRLEARGL